MKSCSVQFSSVTQLCLTLCDPMNLSTPGLPVHHQLPEFIQTHVHQVSDAIQPSHPLLSLLLLPPIPPSIRVFSNESTLSMRWPKYWSFSFNISPSNEHPGLISFRMDCKSVFVLQIISSLHLKYSLSALIYPSMFLKYATGQKVTFRGLDLFRYSLSITSIASLKPQTIK